MNAHSAHEDRVFHDRGVTSGRDKMCDEANQELAPKPTGAPQAEPPEQVDGRARPPGGRFRTRNGLRDVDLRLPRHLEN